VIAAGAQAAQLVAVVAATAERIAAGTAFEVVTSTTAPHALPMLPGVGTGPAGMSGLPPTARSNFNSGVSPSDRTAASRGSGSGRGPAPSGPLRSGPLSGLAAGAGSNGGASGSSGGDGTPAAAFLDPATAPAASTLSAVTATERRITWWYPEVVVSPG
jgi:hypothetical protein